MLDELQRYLKTPVEAVNNVRVFDVDHLLGFLERKVQHFVDEWQENLYG